MGGDTSDFYFPPVFLLQYIQRLSRLCDLVADCVGEFVDSNCVSIPPIADDVGLLV